MVTYLRVNVLVELIYMCDIVLAHLILGVKFYKFDYAPNHSYEVFQLIILSLIAVIV